MFKMLLSSDPHNNKTLPLNLSRLDLSFFSFFTSFFPRLLSSAIFSFIILIEFCVLFNALESLVPSTASSDNNNLYQKLMVMAKFRSGPLTGKKISMVNYLESSGGHAIRLKKDYEKTLELYLVGKRMATQKMLAA